MKGRKGKKSSKTRRGGRTAAPRLLIEEVVFELSGVWFLQCRKCLAWWFPRRTNPLPVYCSNRCRVFAWRGVALPGAWRKP